MCWTCGKKKTQSEDQQAADAIPENNQGVAQPDTDAATVSTVKNSGPALPNATGENTDNITPENMVIPPAPKLLEPSLSAIISRLDSQNIRGACENGSTVFITGAMEASCACIDGVFSFDVTKSVDGIYDFAFGQFENEAFKSSLTLLQWVRDTKTPSPLAIARPGSNPYISGETVLTIAGACEQDSKILISEGNKNSEFLCQESHFSIPVQKDQDGTYDFALIQTDLAGNVSSPVLVQWQRDTAMPPAPNLSLPVANPYISSSPKLNVAGSCLDGYKVNLSLQDNANQEVIFSDTAQCFDNQFAFNIDLTQDTNGEYGIYVNQENTLSHLTSAETSLRWIYDNLIPSAPIIEAPATSSAITSSHNLSISGTCEESATVNLVAINYPEHNTGEICQAGHFSFNLMVARDGIYSYSISQKDLALNESAASVFIWESDTLAPSKPTISAPAESPYFSSNAALAISGACESGSKIFLSGADAQNVLCINDNFSFSVAKTQDQKYDFQVRQIDKAGNSSEAVDIAWHLDREAPIGPQIVSPLQEPFISGGSRYEVSLSCEGSNTVSLSGDDTQVQTCQNQIVSFIVSKSSDGLYRFSFTETDLAGNTSSATTSSWQRDTAQPVPVSVTAPSVAVYSSNVSLLDISGMCSSDHVVSISSGIAANEVAEPQGSLSQTCKNGGWHFKIEKPNDGVFAIKFNQKNPNNNLISGDTNFIWTKDSVAPAKPIVTDPSISPFTSAADVFDVFGKCENDAEVFLTGAGENQKIVCVMSEFSFSVNRTDDGIYSFIVFQRDAASNQSPSQAIMWNRDTAIPLAPSIISPTISPFYTSQATLILSGSCQGPNYEVNLSGDINPSDVMNPAGSLLASCQSDNTYSFAIKKLQDGTYHFAVSQQNNLTQLESAQQHLTWIKDTVAPSAPSIVKPVGSASTSPSFLTIKGGCEQNATVYLTGADTQQSMCSNFEFLFTVHKDVDGTYQFNVTQGDLAGNVSTASAVNWTRDSSALADIEITSPIAPGIFYSSEDQIIISGICTPFLTVTLSGDVLPSEAIIPDNSLSQVCSSAGFFSFNLKKPIVGSYLLNFSQTNFTGTSGITEFQWTIDKAAPVISLSEKPEAVSLVEDVRFVLSANESLVNFYCSLDDENSLVACPSTVSFSQLENGSHVFYVFGEDAAGNKGATLTYSWEQKVFQTLALYHFNNSPGATVDSSLYTTGPLNNALVDSGTSSASLAKFSEGRTMSASGTMSAPSSRTLQLASTSMTVEGWFKMTQSPSKNRSAVLLSKSGNTGDLGWAVKLRRGRSTYQLSLWGSLDGTYQTERRSNSFYINSDVWYFFAVTWNKGEVKFFINGNEVGKSSVGSVGSSVLFNSSADLTLGDALEPFRGVLDEIRLSKSIRYTDSFSIPTQEFNAD